jgi:hypothetical protein
MHSTVYMAYSCHSICKPDWMRAFMQLFAWGLRLETAVGCALDYLFRPRPEVLDLVRESHKALQDTEALKIGIQVQSCTRNPEM